MPNAIPSQQRAKRTIAQVLEAVETLVAAEGAAAVTTTRIAWQTGVAVGTIYRYFPDREALLLAAYDATVERIIAACAGRFAALSAEMDAPAAVAALIDAYLAAAAAIPAHQPLLREMQRLRPVAQDQARSADRVRTEILSPFLARFGYEAPDPGRLAVLEALLSTLVDLYLITEEPEARDNIRAELEAHALLALSRLSGPPFRPQSARDNRATVSSIAAGDEPI